MSATYFQMLQKRDRERDKERQWQHNRETKEMRQILATCEPK